MDTLRIGRGYTARWTVTLRDGDGTPITDTYDGSEALDLIVCGLDGLPVSLLGSSVAWLDPDAGTVLLTLDDSDTVDMAAGPRGLSIMLMDSGNPYEAYRATLRVEAR